MSAKHIKVILISGALILFVLLFIAPKIAPKHPEGDSHDHSPKMAEVSANVDLSVFLNMASKTVSPEQKRTLDRLEAAKNYDSLSSSWSKLKRPDLAAHYAEKSAGVKNKAEDWFMAGNRYYYSVQFTQDKSEMPILYLRAIQCFKKGLALDPKNTDARIMLASCYVESSGNPMEGVNQLREIERTDSNNVKLQLTFAFLSTKSRQFDKAINRFNKVLLIDSTYLEAYLHLADAYEQLGETKKTIEVLEKYASKTPDITSQLEIKKYIDQLKRGQ